jgi:hypothetical protein
LLTLPDIGSRRRKNADLVSGARMLRCRRLLLRPSATTVTPEPDLLKVSY